MTRIALALLALVFALGCATAKLQVTRPVSETFDKISLVVDGSPAVIASEDLSMLRSSLTSSLMTSGVHVVSTGEPGAASLNGTITEYDRGNRALRYLIGFAGGGSFHSNWLVKNAAGAEIGECQIRGSIHAGAFGGSFDDVLEKVGRQLQNCLLGKR